LSDRVLIVENRCAAFSFSPVSSERRNEIATAAAPGVDRSCHRFTCSDNADPHPYLDRPPGSRVKRRKSNRTHAPSSLQNIRLSSYAANPLSRSRNWRADGDGCVGLHLMQVSRRTQACNGLTVQGERWRASLSDRTLIAENRCAACQIARGARRGPWACRGGGRASKRSVVCTRDRVAGAGYACNARPDLHTVCRSFPKISSALSAKVCGGSRSAKSHGDVSTVGRLPNRTRRETGALGM
jgi:hypothetical protein